MQRFLFLLALQAALLLASPCLRAQPPAPPEQDASGPAAWNAHFQATYVRQVQPAFHSTVAGADSLRAQAGASYSITGTAFLGLRLGADTEAYLDPEVAQGVPLSGLVGLAAFPNGELAKTSGSTLTLYRARLFVRHTSELGGDPVAVDNDANQLKSSVDSRRLVVTAGNLSVLDVFDDNPYAHDPRTQFMNWVLMTYGAYDYPADSRGYTDGVAIEYDDDDWVARLGRFTEPKTPNGLPLDRDLFRHYGDQLEIGRDYTFAGQPGSLRVLAFRSLAVMATYADALAAALAGSAPELAAVRDRAQVKRGLGVNVAQSLRDGVGVFLRAMRADGRTETDAFTEADESVSAGVSIKGAAWSRPRDGVGLAFAADAIDAAHRDYLRRGGTTSFLGDGSLRYGAERVAEVYYDVAFGGGFSLTADAQRVADPGYDKARGPAAFYALRLHWES